MTVSKRSYDFSETEYLKVGRLAADRDAFLLLFEVARAATPLNLAKLCGRFRAGPEVVDEVFSELAALGMCSRQSGSYLTTPFGESVIALMEDVANEFRPQPEVPKTQACSVFVAQGYSLAATNNSVRGTFSNCVSVVNTAPGVGKSITTPTATDLNLADVGPRQAEVKNAPRNHNYLR